MSETAHIVVVDDEADLRNTVGEYLSLKGYQVTLADGGEALRAVFDGEDGGGDVDLVLLDISMPGEDGLSLARFLRESVDVAIIMLTAAGDVVDRIVGLEMGADDYLAKPVDLRELLARIKSVLRRAQVAPAAGSMDSPKSAGSNQVRFGQVILDLDSHVLLDGGGEAMKLTAMEYDLLKAFAEHPGRVLNRDQLLDLAHNKDWEPFDRSIDIRIARLRRKIERDPSKPQILKTVRGAGYMFVPDGG